MRGSDTAGYSLCAVASLEDASAPVRTNAKSALKPRRRAVGPSTHITPVLSPNSQTYKSSLSISYRAPSPSPSSHDRSSPSPPARRTSRTPIQPPSTLRSPRLANISTSATLPQRHRRTRSLVTPQPSVSPLSTPPLSKLALPPSPLSPPFSTFRFPASPQTPSSLRRFTTHPISPTSSTRSTSKHHHRLLAPDTLFISPPRSKPTLAMSIQVHAPIITPTHSPRVHPSHPSHSHSSHPSYSSTSTSHYPQSQAQSSPRHSPRPSLTQNPTQGPSHSHTNSPRVRASSPPPLMLDTPQIPRPSSRCERLLRDTLRKADEHERAVLFAASTSASYAYSPNGRRGAYSPNGRRALKRSESYAGVGAGAGAGVVDPDDDEDAETQVEGVLFRPPLGHAHSSTSAHIYRAVSVAQEKVGQDANGANGNGRSGQQDTDTKRGRATERERYPAPGEEYVSVGYGAYAPHGAVLRSQLESVLRAAAASGHGRHERHGREGREGRHERRESYESTKSGKSGNGGAKEGRARRSRERDGQREWCWANSPESSSIPSPTAHSSISTTPSYPSYAALPALTATAPLPTSNSSTLPHRNSNSNRSSNTNSNRNSTSTTSTIEPLTPPPTPPSHAHAHQLARSQSHPQSHCPSPNSSPFNARSAAKKLRDMDGYVSFANVEGLGNPPGEDDYDEESGAEGAGEGGIMRGLWKVLSAGKGAGAGVGRSRSGGRVGA